MTDTQLTKEQKKKLEQEQKEKKKQLEKEQKEEKKRLEKEKKEEKQKQQKEEKQKKQKEKEMKKQKKEKQDDDQNSIDISYNDLNKNELSGNYHSSNLVSDQNISDNSIISKNQNQNNKFINYSFYQDIIQDSDQELPTTQQILKLIGQQFVDNMGENINYDITNNFNLNIILIGAQWCMCCKQTLQQIAKFQCNANEEEKQIEVIYVSLDPFKENMLQVMNQCENFMAIPYDNTEQRQSINQLFSNYQQQMPKIAVIDHEGKCLQGNILIDDIYNHHRKPQKCIFKWQKLMELQQIQIEDTDDEYNSSDAHSSDCEWDDEEKKMVQTQIMQSQVQAKQLNEDEQFQFQNSQKNTIDLKQNSNYLSKIGESQEFQSN